LLLALLANLFSTALQQLSASLADLSLAYRFRLLLLLAILAFLFFAALQQLLPLLANFTYCIQPSVHLATTTLGSPSRSSGFLLLLALLAILPGQSAGSFNTKGGAESKMGTILCYV
jgi:hypothetical protein